VKYYLKKHEAFEPGLRRVIRALLLQASQVAATKNIPEGDRIHVVRKRLKRVRAIHKLAWPVLEEARCDREQAWFRDRGRLLSEARDVDVLLETHRQLAQRNVASPGVGGAGDPVQGELLRCRHEVRLAAPPSRLLGKVAQELIAKAQEWDAVSWVPTEADLIGDALTSGIGRYGRALADADRSPTGERFHTLRKRIKDLAYQMDFMARRIPAAGARLRGKADRLGELLGWHHDLWLFADRVAAMDGLSDVVRDSWERLTERERMLLEPRALAKADRFRRAMAKKAGER
jgi:CHAD domain-containing protein